MMKKLSDCSSRGKLMLLTGLLIAAPLAVLPFYPEDTKYIPAFALPALLSFLIGAVVCLMGHSGPAPGSGSLTVLFAWGWGIVIGALPFFLGGQLSALQAVFESVSGWTTTGLSVMDVSKTPNIYLFHRSFMQFCGGLGFVMMMLLIAPDKRSMGLFQAEGHPDKLAPSLRRTARTVFSMYCGFLAFGTAAYRIVGMDLFDGLCHAMCAMSTGGFSTRLNSIGEYQSLPIELVTILLMLVGTTNFAVLLLMVRRKWRQALRVSELRFMALLLAVFVPVTAFSLSSGLGMRLEEGFRRAAFDVASALSIQQLENRLANVVVENQDFETLIHHYDRPDTFFYLDPPYFSTEDMYAVEFAWADHVRLRDTVASMQGKFLLSYNDCPEIRELYEGFPVFDFTRVHSMAQRYEAGKEFKELLIGNYDLFEREKSKPAQMKFEI